MDQVIEHTMFVLIKVSKLYLLKMNNFALKKKLLDKGSFTDRA